MTWFIWNVAAPAALLLIFIAVMGSLLSDDKLGDRR